MTAGLISRFFRAASLTYSLIRSGLWPLVVEPQQLEPDRRGRESMLARWRAILRGVLIDRTPNRLFDSAFYLRDNPDVAESGISPFWHFARYGAKEGRAPHPLFDPSFYLERHPSAARASGGPFGHFLRVGARRGSDPHPLFDTSFYVESRPEHPVTPKRTNPLVHFLHAGAGSGRDPHPLFDTSYYLANNPAVPAAKINPLTHFVQYGGKEGRAPHPLFDSGYYSARYLSSDTDENPLIDFLLHGAAQGKNPHLLFDCDFYVGANPDVSFEAVNPLAHFVLRGAKEGRSPHPHFDIERYTAEHPELQQSGANPLVDFLERRDSPADLAAAADLRRATLKRTYVLDPAEAGLVGDTAIAIHDLGVFVSGYGYGSSREMLELRLRSATDHHETDDLLTFASRPMREDAPAPSRSAPVRGFDCFVRDPLIFDGFPYLYLTATWSGEARSTLCIGIEEGTVSTQAGALLDLLQARLTFYAGSRKLRNALDTHFGPAVEALWQRRDLRPPGVEEFRYGAPLADPRVSIVIPVYGRLDLVEHQLAVFANDPDLRRAEILYVLDDPRLEPVAAARCNEWYRLYRVPFRLLCLERNLGFAGASNLGAAKAVSNRLLFLNSDVIPKTRRWLSRALDSFDALPEPGVMGFRLLWEDESVQHDGLGFRQDADHGLWVNVHPLKGLSGVGNLADGPFEVPSVTGAAMLMTRPLFESLDGFDEGFIIGGYEDSDLCLRASSAGSAVWMEPRVELFHLEGESQVLHHESANTEARMWYNAWRQDRLHGDRLTRLAEKHRYRSGGILWVRSHDASEAVIPDFRIAHPKRISSVK